MKCPNCNAEVTGRFCSYCGSEMPKEKETVNITDNRSTVINNYYTQAAPTTSAPVQRSVPVIPVYSKKSKAAALILCIFLGYFGVHYFYVGKTGTGLLYLFTFGLFDPDFSMEYCINLCDSIWGELWRKNMSVE